MKVVLLHEHDLADSMVQRWVKNPKFNAPPPKSPSASGEEFRRVQGTVQAIIEQPEQRRVPTLKRWFLADVQ